ncbi:hypothetical protein EVJ58_g5144 [Rhodofomes roseus]|uniref:DNA2/NAM7 helicase-like C-terminal domain-containing protein n=1 Tax=Rhodofomes roseus TaxID=34475 RepID=A0A4Y9YD41_9APHY|nr:hypothetical protein EVJ58_g5144 [Rhodofomes roseus]
MVQRRWTLEQTLVRTPPREVLVTEVDESDLVDFNLDTFLALSGDVLGVACAQGAKGLLTHISFATPTYILCVRITGLSATTRTAGEQARAQRHSRGRKVLQSMLLHSEEYCKVAFDMHRMALALYHDYQLTIVNAIDLQSVRDDLRTDRQAVETFMSYLGRAQDVNKRAVFDNFKGKAFGEGGVQNAALRAWAACHAGLRSKVSEKLQSATPIDTTVIPVNHLKWLATFTRVAWRLHALKPTRVKNDVCADFSHESGELHLLLTRYKTRPRPSNSQRLQVQFSAKNGSKTVQGHTIRVEGKTAAITVNRPVASTAKILSVVTRGKEDLTAAETDREAIVLAVLQQRLPFFEHPFVRPIFESPDRHSSRTSMATNKEICLGVRRLNDSQASAVHRIISEDPADKLCLVQGPPGTGKTTVIAAAVIDLMKVRKAGPGGIWLFAQSNVAVKNIAEKLAQEKFFSFRILVSKDFHFEWHEHLYGKIERNVIRSELFTDHSIDTETRLLGSKVILCTLSMLSNPRLMMSGYTRLVPVETVIVDEASQIEMGDYVPLLGRFNRTLKKLVFIGDDKQLAPYGQEDLGELASVFEMQHLQRDALFLNTQYRMPTPIGKFISSHVYDNKLQTEHDIVDRGSCIFIDVKHGSETKSGKSWTNSAEADAIVVVAKKYIAEGKKFRVITPYDAQRNLLERQLKGALLPWENKCFNVDSFQGNEEDYILISVVRSDKIGFLNNSRRTNVMLSRCKRGMVICTSRAFMEGKAQSSLVGKLAKEWADDGRPWVSWRDVLQGKF